MQQARRHVPPLLIEKWHERSPECGEHSSAVAVMAKYRAQAQARRQAAAPQPPPQKTGEGDSRLSVQNGARYGGEALKASFMPGVASGGGGAVIVGGRHRVRAGGSNLPGFVKMQ